MLFSRHVIVSWGDALRKSPVALQADVQPSSCHETCRRRLNPRCAESRQLWRGISHVGWERERIPPTRGIEGKSLQGRNSIEPIVDEATDRSRRQRARKGIHAGNLVWESNVVRWNHRTTGIKHVREGGVNYSPNWIPCARGSSVDQLMVLVWRRM